MALTQVTGPYPIFTDLDGTPLDDGYLYIGDINQDPEQNPIQVFWDANLTIQATQPIRTSNGYAYRNGTPALLYTGGEFSITIRNKREEFVLYSPVGYGFDPAAVSASVVKNDFVGNGVQLAFVLSASPSTILATNIFINGVYQEKDSYTLAGNTITFSIAPPLNSSIEILTNETGIINSGNATAISYTAGFAGATLQTVQTKLEQYVSVKDFGAVGDGVTDDTAAINAAISSIAALGGNVVLLPAGTYAVGTPILLKSNVTLQGEGFDSTIIKQIGTIAAWDAITTSTGVISTLVANEYENIHVKGLKLEGLYSVPIPDGSANYAVNGISIANTIRSSVSDCYVQDTGTGIIIYGAVTGAEVYDNMISGCTVTNARSWNAAGNPGAPRGITMATNYSNVENCISDNNYTGYFVATDYGTYINCRTTRWTDDGFYVNANFCRFTDCWAIGNTTLGTASGSGFAVNPSYGHTFTSCVALRCPNAGMRFRHAGATAPSSNRIIGCYFSDCGYGFLDDMTGADAYPNAVSSFNVFIGNQADNCQQSGFKFIRQQAGVISGNTAWDNNQAGVILQTRGGISLDEYCLDNAISDNICADTQGVPTQTFGLYSYPAATSGASVENTGNRISHKSINGIDLFYTATLSNTASATILSGTRSISGTVTFALPFQTAPVVVAGVQNVNALADAERPITVNVYSVTATGFTYIVDALANVAANRSITVGWTANSI